MSHVSFESDIKPLFRYKDINAMRNRFDLSSYDDVKANADLIFSRIDDGTMPCDSPWEEDKVSLFTSWIEGGCKP